MITTAAVGRNKDLFADVMSMYAKDGYRVIDVTYGNGNFWKELDTTKWVFNGSDLLTGVDARCLPYETGSIDIEVFDPPYMHNASGTVKDSISASYNINGTPNLRGTDDIISLYADVFIEARRVLKPKTGLLVVKCQDGIESGKQRWNHIVLYNIATALGFVAEDLFVLIQSTTPANRWEHQKHARKNHSYFWVFRRGR